MIHLNVHLGVCKNKENKKINENSDNNEEEENSYNYEIKKNGENRRIRRIRRILTLKVMRRRWEEEAVRWKVKDSVMLAKKDLFH